MVADHQSGRDQGGIIEPANGQCAANLAWPLDCSSNPKRPRLLRPPAIVPNVSAIIPRNRLALDSACCALQRIVWNIGIENCHVTFDAINNVSVHGTIPHKPLVPPAIILRNTRPDESKWQEDAADTKYRPALTSQVATVDGCGCQNSSPRRVRCGRVRQQWARDSGAAWTTS